MRSFEIVSVNVSERKGTSKTPVERIELVEGVGVAGDAHAGPGGRQVSLLAAEDIDAMNARGAGLSAGDFAENVTTRGVRLHELAVGTRIRLGEAVLEVTQIGKECVRGCAIRERVGDCIMPTHGVFARVVKGGWVSRESACSYDF